MASSAAAGEAYVTIPLPFFLDWNWNSVTRPTLEKWARRASALVPYSQPRAKTVVDPSPTPQARPTSGARPGAGIVRA